MNANTGGFSWLFLGATTPYDAGYQFGYQAGQVMGPVIVWLGLLAGIFFCWRHSRKPRANRKGALSLALFFAAIFLLSVAVTAQKLPLPPALLQIFVALSALMALGMAVTGVVLAILALQEFSRSPGAYTRGFAPAIWTLALTTVFLGLVLISAIHRMSLRMAGHPGLSEWTTMEDYNFRYKTPETPWMWMDAAKLNKDARLAFMRVYPDSYFAIMPLKVGTRSELTTSRFTDMCMEHVRAVSGGTMQILSQGEFTLNGMAGRLVEVQADVADHSLYYKQWFCVTNGYAYELMGWGRIENRDRLATDFQAMFTGFKQIDPSRLAMLGQNQFTTNFSSPHYNYRVNVTNSSWGAFADKDKSFPYAEFGASQGDTCLVVVPLWLGEHKLGIDALSAAFLATMNIPYSNDSLFNRKRLTEAGLDGVQFDFNREVENIPFRYRFRILQGGGCGWMVAVWTQRSAGVEALFDDALGRVTLNTGPAPADPTPDFSAQERKSTAFILNQAGLYHENAGEYEKALPLFRAAVETGSSNSVYLENALQAWVTLDRPAEALAFLDRQQAGLQAVPNVQASRAYLQAKAGYDDLAISNYAALFASGFRSDTHFTEYVNLLAGEKQYDRALTETTNYLQDNDSIAVRLAEASVFRLKKDFPAAIAILEAERGGSPGNSQIEGALAETYIGQKQYNKALEISRQLLDEKGESAYAYYLRGQSELGLKWYREARKSFEAAARLAPANKEISSYLDYLSGLMGEGGNSEVREVIDPVAIPPSLTVSLAAASKNYATNYGAYYVRRIRAVAYTSGQGCKSTESTVTHILDAYGVSAFSTVQVDFDPLAEQVYVNDVRVLDAQGNTVSTGNIDDYYVMDAESTRQAGGKKVLNIPVSGLQAGDDLAVTVTRRQLGPDEGFTFCEHIFSAPFPCRESVFFLTGDVGHLQYRTSFGKEPDRLSGGLCWRLPNPVTAEWEPSQPPPSTFLPTLWVGDAATHWPDIASNYLSSISDRLAPDPSVGQLARNLLPANADEDTKIAVLSRYVQTNFVYKAIEFGRRARIPNSPADILHNRYGDCKDHSLLLQQLLTTVGVPASLAVVNTRDAIRPDLPSLDQFDHMIVYAQARSGAKFLDCTSKGADVAQTIPYDQAGRQALVLDARNPRLVTVPDYPADASGVAVQQHLHLQDQTDLAGEETVSLTGVAAAIMRDYLLLLPRNSQKAAFQNEFSTPDATLTDLQIDSIYTPSLPLRIKLTYVFKKQFQPLDGRLTGALRAGLVRSYLVPRTEERRTPFEYLYANSLHLAVDLDAPPGFTAALPATPDVKLDPRFASCTVNTRLNHGGLHLEFDCRKPAGKFAATDYPACQNTMNKALSMLEQTVVFKPAGS